MSKLYLMAIDTAVPSGTRIEVAKTLREVLGIPLTEGAEIYGDVLVHGPHVLNKAETADELSDDQWQLARNQALVLRIDPSDEVLTAAKPVPEPAEGFPDPSPAVRTSLVLMGVMHGDVVDSIGLAALLCKSTEDDLFREVMSILGKAYRLEVTL